MFKNLLVLEVKGGRERIHQYQGTPESPLGEIYDALSAMKIYVLQLMNEAEKKESEQKDSDEKGE